MKKSYDFNELNTRFDVNIEHMMYDAPHKNRVDVYDSMYTWCQQNCKGEVIIGMMFVTFTDKDDAFAFKLRWY